MINVDGKMKPIANQAAKLLTKPKTHKFNNLEDSNVEMNFKSTRDQTVTFSHNCSKVVAKYLKVSAASKYTLSFQRCCKVYLH